VDNKNDRSSRLEILKQFMRFNIIGVLNTTLTYGIYAGLVAVGVHPLVAVVLEYAFGIVFSYMLNKRFTFKLKKRAGLGMFARMVAAYLPMLLLNAVLLWIIVDILHWNKYLGQAAALAFVSVLSFAAQRIFVFRVFGDQKELTHGE
jgi:putative flippase GtrA